MHLYSCRLTAMTTFSSVLMLELFPACISPSNCFNLSQNSLGLEDENRVFLSIGFYENDFFWRDPAMKTGDLSNLKRDLFPELLLPNALSS